MKNIKDNEIFYLHETNKITAMAMRGLKSPPLLPQAITGVKSGIYLCTQPLSHEGSILYLNYQNHIMISRQMCFIYVTQETVLFHYNNNVQSSSFKR